MTQTFEYVAATDLDEVLAALADGGTSVLAGGQSLVPELSAPGAPRRRVVDINRVAGLDTLVEADGFLRVGPLVRHRTFESEAVGGPLGELLRAVVRHIGHPPIRARGTMLGSLAYAHPAAEWPAVAVALGAEMVLTGPAGCRTVPAAEFFTGPFGTARRPEELLVEVRLPVLPVGTGIGYAEDRRTTIFPEAAAFAAVTMAGGRVTAAAIGLVNAGPCPVRGRAAEKVLVGSDFSDATIAAAAATAADTDAMIGAEAAGAADTDPVLGPAARAAGALRRRAIRTLTRRALSQARERTVTGCA
ncbi:carbon-monoxide dehydrogenase medium subunit [Actinoplanes ianthinogenes]|uniref:Carbon-monoxide dehydrogenase medium subunit n=1 Tax=Actinoplanes ianthinogenes TaxID=122358 RepID=A0ABM7M4W9_9ACTN|nr:FAD binding domain-containing protein [Actinoplanes ianthinogenes]BCJ46696.1 carbon-monoxide dehydrogenase medium subunit [Actinoplanes ianthinogenes]GGR16281.1 carbon-monoxide dehydrogenase medium subunit [Actinoplanes ianthinogenes]